MRPGTFGLASAVALAFAANAQPVFGVVTQWDEEVPCATFRVSGLAGTPVTIEAFDPRRTIAASIQGQREPCHQRALIEGSSYALTVPLGTADIFVAPAVLTGSAEPGVSFEVCESMEGIHLIAKRGKRRVWHEYFYLAYDLEPSCTAAQLAE
jgi:hypothetical protein